jgi:hypothetical protein
MGTRLFCIWFGEADDVCGMLLDLRCLAAIGVRAGRMPRAKLLVTCGLQVAENLQELWAREDSVAASTQRQEGRKGKLRAD